jgi:hypothetical protein
MVDDEAPHVAHEVEDYCPLSLNDLKQKLTERRASWQNAHDSLEVKVRMLDARGQAAVQCLLVRDCHHLFALYLSFVMSKIHSERSGYVPWIMLMPPPAPSMPPSNAAASGSTSGDPSGRNWSKSESSSERFLRMPLQHQPVQRDDLCFRSCPPDGAETAHTFKLPCFLH